MEVISTPGRYASKEYTKYMLDSDFLRKCLHYDVFNFFKKNSKAAAYTLAYYTFYMVCHRLFYNYKTY